MAPEFAVYTACLGANSNYELTVCCPELLNCGNRGRPYPASISSHESAVLEPYARSVRRVISEWGYHEEATRPAQFVRVGWAQTIMTHDLFVESQQSKGDDMAGVARLV